MGDNLWSKFTENIQNDNSESKIIGIKLLPKILNESNYKKFTNELIPFTLSLIDEEDDEAIIELLKATQTIVAIGVAKPLAHKFLSFVELGLLSYSSKVRDEAITVYKSVLKESLANKEFDPNELVLKLTGSTVQKYRIAFLSIIPHVYKYLNSSQKAKVTSFLKQFSYEGNEFIKKSLAASLKDISFFINEDNFKAITSNLLDCTNEMVRMPIMACIANLKYHQNLNILQEYIQQLIPLVGKDESWRVRYSLAINISEILSFSILSNSLKKELIKQKVALLNDSEIEVKCACIKKFGTCLERVFDDVELLNLLIDSFEKFVNTESNSLVKEAIAENLVSISKNIPKAKIRSVIVPLCLELLRTNISEVEIEKSKGLSELSLSPIIEKKKVSSSAINSPIANKKSTLKKSNSGSQITIKSSAPTHKTTNAILYDNSGCCDPGISVILKTIKSIPALIKLYQHEFEPAVLTTIESMYSILKWKSKVKLLVILLELTSYFSKKALSFELYNLIAQKGINENVYQVRELSLKCLVEIMIKSQDGAAESKIIAMLEKMRLSQSFQQRSSVIFFISNYVKAKGSNENLILSSLLPIIIEGLIKDRVPNIRYSSAQVLQYLQSQKFSTLKIKSCLEELAKDNDEEIKNLVASAN